MGYTPNYSKVYSRTIKFKKDQSLLVLLTSAGSGYSAKLVLNSKIIGTCTLMPMVGNCGMMISTELNINKEQRRKGFTAIFRSAMYDILKEAGFSYIIATTILSNEIEIKSARKAGWEIIDGFNNSRTKNEILIIGKQLN